MTIESVTTDSNEDETTVEEETVEATVIAEEAETASSDDDDFVSPVQEDAARLVEFMARALVDDPDGVNVAVVDADRATIYELTVGDGELGRVIGREGRTARAMRQILTSANSGSEKRAVLDILDS